jgi:hypothetical protein
MQGLARGWKEADAALSLFFPAPSLKLDLGTFGHKGIGRGEQPWSAGPPVPRMYVRSRMPSCQQGDCEGVEEVHMLSQSKRRLSKLQRLGLQNVAHFAPVTCFELWGQRECVGVCGVTG